MSRIQIAQVAGQSGWKVVHFGLSYEAVSSDNVTVDRYRPVLRIIIRNQVKLLPEIAFQDFTPQIATAQTLFGLSFNGTTEREMSVPAGFSLWRLMRQDYEAVDVEGSLFYDVTEEYMSKGPESYTLAWSQGA